MDKLGKKSFMSLISILIGVIALVVVIPIISNIMNHKDKLIYEYSFTIQYGDEDSETNYGSITNKKYLTENILYFLINDYEMDLYFNDYELGTSFLLEGFTEDSIQYRDFSTAIQYNDIFIIYALDSDQLPLIAITKNYETLFFYYYDELFINDSVRLVFHK